MMKTWMGACALLLLCAAGLTAQEGRETATVDDARYEARRAWNGIRRDLDRELEAAPPEKKKEIEERRRAALETILAPLWAALEAMPEDEDAPKALIWILRQGSYDEAPARRAAKLIASRHADHEDAYRAARYLARSEGAAWTTEPLEALARSKQPRTRAWAAYALAAGSLGRAGTPQEQTKALDRLAALEKEAADHQDVVQAIALLTKSYRFAPGRPAPEIEGVDLDGTSFRLSDYRGKVVLLDFWGTW